jgi:sugar-specific transcriptional regulator TrmB
MKYRISQRLQNHLNELRKRAIKEKNEKLRSDYWWLYFNGKGIESEIREMMLKTENVTLIEMMTNYGLTEIILEDQKDIAPPAEDEEEEVSKPPVDDDVNDDDIPPRQKRLWEDEE